MLPTSRLRRKEIRPWLKHNSGFVDRTVAVPVAADATGGRNHKSKTLERTFCCASCGASMGSRPQFRRGTGYM